MSADEKRRQALLRHFYLSFFKGSIAVCTIGAYITFQLVVTPSASTETSIPTQIFLPESFRMVLAVAWLLYLLSLTLSATALLCLSYTWATERPQVHSHSHDASSIFGGPLRVKKQGLFGWDIDMWASVSAGITFFIILCAFAFTSLSVAAYNVAIGVVGLVLIASFMLISLVIWIRHLVRTSNRTSRSSMMLESKRVSKLGPELEAGLWNMMTQGGAHPIQSPTQQQFPSQHMTSPTSRTATPAASKTGTLSRPTTRRHQPIIIRDPRAPMPGDGTEEFHA